MPKLLQLRLNQDYKSFKSGFSQDFVGDLILLSGVNGSGKTQLFDVIRGHLADTSKKITRSVTQSNSVLEEVEIVHKSFRDYSSIGDITSAHVSSRIGVRDTIFSWYGQFQLDFKHQNAGNFRDTIRRAKTLLINAYGLEKFNSGTLTRQEIANALPADFVQFEDDIFTNRIGEIFFNYVSLVHNKHANASKSGMHFDASTLPIPPWKELNDVFSKLQIAYRFRDSYERIEDEINEQPVLFALRPDGSLDTAARRPLSELSDGEKALITLTFAVLASTQTQPKLLLLDEYDATLNPSLITAFFAILEEFFVRKGVQVVVVTHSPATLSLAPDYSAFYEIYRQYGGQQRVLQVRRDQYEELAIANRKFYEKIENQKSRYIEMTAENDALRAIIARLPMAGAASKLQVVTEGRNTEHIRQALTVIDRDLLARVEIVSGVEDRTGKQQLKSAFDIVSSMPGISPTLFVWDCDAEGTVSALANSALCTAFSFTRNNQNSIFKGGIENLYPEDVFTEEVFEPKSESVEGGTKVLRLVNKGIFLAKVMTLTHRPTFDKFQPLVDTIRSLVP